MGCVIPHQSNAMNIPHQTNAGLRNYHYSLRNSPEEGISHLLSGRSLKYT